MAREAGATRDDGPHIMRHTAAMAKANASWRRSLRGGRLPWHERRDPDGHLWAPAPRLSAERSKGGWPQTLIALRHTSATRGSERECNELAQRAARGQGFTGQIGRSVSSGARGRELNLPLRPPALGTWWRMRGPKRDGSQEEFSAIQPWAWTSAAQLFSRYIEGPWLPLWLPLPSHLGLESVVLGIPAEPARMPVCECAEDRMPVLKWKGVHGQRGCLATV